MNNYRLINIVFIVLAFLIAVASGDELDDHHKAKEALQGYAPELQKLSQAHPDDLEIQIGIANLIRGNRLGVQGINWEREQFEKILVIDPDNLYANAVLARIRACNYAGKLSLLSSLERMIDNTKQRGVDKLRLTSTRQFSGYLNDYAQEIKPTHGKKGHFAPYFVIDFDVARKVLREKLHAESVPVLKMLDETEVKDPDNAIYDYLRARIYYELGNIEAALAAMEKGSQKKYLEQYIKQAELAERRVLDEIDFPQNMRVYVSGARVQFISVIGDIWEKDSSRLNLKKGLGDIAAEYESQGNLKKADKVYKVFTKAFEQCEPEIYIPRDVFMKNVHKKIDKYRVRPKKDTGDN
ncbi:MAG: hypothetical protein K9M75_03710 [Phycisphaerae bacterium]|nr:hypothetical protein [Phycisphaerae bacterium]